ncbi:MAG: glycerol-3-phosphate 1-O-acyltransferase PlsY [candidate division WOR-3 bacterium]|nr:glycerol-3-phosphate 1-O-acyltransferase PlsY [candidate division WOR-3 bacterium]
MWTVLAFIGSYALGSIPFGYIVGKIKGHNLKEEGSRNIGASNVFRVVGKKEGILVFILDLLKGFLPVLYFSGISPIVGIFGALGAVLGHVTTPFLHFRGGKGISTGFGSVLALMPIPALLSFGVWLVLLAVTRRVSVGSLAGALALPLFYFFLNEPVIIPVLVIAILITVIVFISHRKNIKRLIKGEEKAIF